MFPVQFRRRCQVGALSTAVLFLLSATVAQAAFPGANGKIAFGRCDNDGCAIWTMDGNGAGAAPLTSGGDISPAYSADGKRIVYQHSGSDGSGMVVANSDGSDPSLLTIAADGLVGYDGPTFSADGKTIAFTGFSFPFVDEEVWSVSSAGGPLAQVTSPFDHEFSYEPAFSPDGSKIAFEHGSQIYVMNVDGSDEVPVTPVTVGSADESPAFSPDGKYIAFQRLSYGSSQGVIMVAPVSGGAAATAVTAPAADQSDGQPAFSPDGSQIVFVRSLLESTQYGNLVSSSGISSVPAAGGQVTTLTSSSGGDTSPDWQPVAAASDPPPPTDSHPTVAPPADPPTPPMAPVATLARIPGIASHTIRTRRGVATLLVTCPAAGVGSCAGTLTLQATLKRDGARRPKPTTIGKTKFLAQPGRAVALSVRLSKAARAALKDHGRLLATAQLTPLTGHASSITLKLTG